MYMILLISSKIDIFTFISYQYPSIVYLNIKLKTTEEKLKFPATLISLRNVFQ